MNAIVALAAAIVLFGAILWGLDALDKWFEGRNYLRLKGRGKR